MPFISFAEDQAIAAGLYPSSQTFAALLEAALSVGDADSADYWYQGRRVDGPRDSHQTTSKVDILNLVQSQPNK